MYLKYERKCNDVENNFNLFGNLINLCRNELDEAVANSFTRATYFSKKQKKKTFQKTKDIFKLSF